MVYKAISTYNTSFKRRSRPKTEKEKWEEMMIPDDEDDEEMPVLGAMKDEVMSKEEEKESEPDSKVEVEPESKADIEEEEDYSDNFDTTFNIVESDDEDDEDDEDDMLLQFMNQIQVAEAEYYDDDMKERELRYQREYEAKEDGICEGKEDLPEFYLNKGVDSNLHFHYFSIQEMKVFSFNEHRENVRNARSIRSVGLLRRYENKIIEIMRNENSKIVEIIMERDAFLMRNDQDGANDIHRDLLFAIRDKKKYLDKLIGDYLNVQYFQIHKRQMRYVNDNFKAGAYKLRKVPDHKKFHYKPVVKKVEWPKSLLKCL